MNWTELTKNPEVTVREVSFATEINVEQIDSPYGEKEIPTPRTLLPEQKKEVQAETGWSEGIVDAVGSMEEYEIYREAGLQEAEVGEKECLIRPDIDMEQKDGFGRTNRERMEQGLAPLTPEGRPYELHHIGQHQDSPLAELTMQEHRGKGNDTILHIKTKESEIDREEFSMERANHWQNRANEVNKYE
jgi:hypothetical protein